MEEKRRIDAAAHRGESSSSSSDEDHPKRTQKKDDKPRTRRRRANRPKQISAGSTNATQTSGESGSETGNTSPENCAICLGRYELHVCTVLARE